MIRPIKRKTSVIGVYVLVLVVTPKPPSADAQKIYWLESPGLIVGENGNGKILRADLDFNGVVETLLTDLTSPYAITLDPVEGKLYWSDLTQRAIHRADLDGASAETVISLADEIPIAVSVDVEARRLYWAAHRGDTGQGRLYRADIETWISEEFPLAISFLTLGVAFDFDSETVFWTDTHPGRIQWASFDGTNLQVVPRGSALPWPIVFDQSTSGIFWAEKAHRGRRAPISIMRLGFDKAKVEQLLEFSFFDEVYGLAIDGNHEKLYWFSRTPPNIQRANLDGSDVEDILSLDGLFFGSIALDLRQPVTAAMAIRPGSCPGPVNVRSRGVLPVAVLGSEALDVTQIKWESLRLSRADGTGEAVLPLDQPPGRVGAVADIGSPAGDGPCVCHASTPDGFDDLLLKFSVPELVEAFGLRAEPRGQSIMLQLTGTMHDGRDLTAADCILPLGPK